MQKEFKLDARLSNDTFFVGNLKLCQVLLMNDSRFPWLILVPRRPDVSELFDLGEKERQLLVEECAYVGEALKSLTKADKMNIATLGNAVPQLHVHVIARFRQDEAWPSPIWGHGNSQEFSTVAKNDFVSKLLKLINFIDL